MSGFPDRPSARRPGLAAAGAASLLTVILAAAGCAPTPSSSAEPSPSTSAPAASPSASTTTAPPAAPALVPGGTAEENLAFFATVVSDVWRGADNDSGRAYIDALSAAGFDKASMQVTNDTSTVGNRAESLQFSVAWGEQCLVGQVGPATGDPVTAVVPVVTEGRCLVGLTRPIDW